MMRRAAGFSLIEVIVAVVIVGILASIALPAYQNSVYKARRADAKSALTATAQRLERCFTRFGAYDDANCPVDASFASDEGYYTVQVVSDATTYTLSATPAGAQTGDTKCSSLSLDSGGDKTATGSAAGECW